MACQPVAGGEDQSPLLGGRDAGGRAAEVAARAQPHLDEDRGVAVAADEVDLAALDAEVAPDDAQAARHEHLRRRALRQACAFGLPACGHRMRLA